MSLLCIAWKKQSNLCAVLNVSLGCLWSTEKWGTSQEHQEVIFDLPRPPTPGPRPLQTIPHPRDWRAGLVPGAARGGMVTGKIELCITIRFSDNHHAALYRWMSWLNRILTRVRRNFCQINKKKFFKLGYQFNKRLQNSVRKQLKSCNTQNMVVINWSTMPWVQ